MISRLRQLILVLAGCLVLAPSVQAQKGGSTHVDVDAHVDEICTSRFEEMKADGLQQHRPFALLMERGAMSHDCTITAFFALNLPNWSAPDRQSMHVLKRSYQHMRSEPQTHFADSTSCEAVRTTMGSLAELEVLAIDVPGLKPLPERGIIVADGSSYMFWSDQLVNGDERMDSGEVTIVASNNWALGVLAGKISDLPEDCWRATEPALS